MEGSGTYKEYILEVIRIFFIILLIYAGVTKLIGYEQFKIQLSQFPFISSYARLIAWTVPIAEILIALLFFPYRFIKIGLYATFALISMFTFYIITVLNFSESIPCSCGGVIPSLSWKEHLVFNVACAVLAYLGIWIWQSQEKF